MGTNFIDSDLKVAIDCSLRIFVNSHLRKMT